MRQEQAGLFERMCEVISILADANRELYEVLAQAAKIEALESKVAERTGYYNYIGSNMNESYKPTIQKLVGKGLLQGNENGELMLTNDMMRILTIIDRTGVFG